MPFIDRPGDVRALGVPPLSPPRRPHIGAVILMGPAMAMVVAAEDAHQIAVHTLHLLRKLDRAAEIVDVVVLTPIANYLVEARALAALHPSFL